MTTMHSVCFVCFLLHRERERERERDKEKEGERESASMTKSFSAYYHITFSFVQHQGSSPQLKLRVNFPALQLLYYTSNWFSLPGKPEV
jgi:hypothetical protein